MMENAKEKLNHLLLPKKEKYTQNAKQQKGKKDHAMDPTSVSDRNDLILDSIINKCCFCTKVFLNSKFLIQHILRRHSENLVAMYRKLNDLNIVNQRDHLNQHDINRIITNEFSKLRDDLEFIKSSVSDNKYNPSFYHTSSVKGSNDSLVRENSVNLAGKVDILTSNLQALRVTNEKIETDISDLKALWNECGVESFFSSSNVKDTLIYQTLKDDVLLELQNLILENSEKQKLDINQLSLNLKADVERLELLMKRNLEKIDTSTLVQETIKSLEKEIEFFFSCHKAKKFKSHVGELNVSEEIIPKVKKVKPSANHEMINLGTSENALLLEKKLSVLNIPTGTKKSSPTLAKQSSCSDCKIKKFEMHDSELNLLKEIGRKVKKVHPDSGHEMIDFGIEFEKKLNAFNIPVGTIRLSNTDYTAKMKLVESEREALSKKYQPFSDVFQCLNSSLDKNVSRKLKEGKKSRKIRFSLTPKQSRKKPKNNSEDSDVKFAKRISDSPMDSSTECVCVL